MPRASVLFGTSSFSSKDWVGPFYPLGTPAGAYLVEYAKHFPAVEIDSTYYAVPSARVVDGWADKTPEDFVLCAKFPREIVHGGKEAKPDGRTILTPDATYAVRDRFLEVMRRVGPRLGPLLIQFPYFNRAAFPSPGRFLERLDDFLDDLPRDGFSYAVEIRNRAWLTKAWRDLLAKHRAALTLVDQAWMPHGDEIEKKIDPVTADDVYVRLLGDRKAIEQITKTWDREVIDHGPSLARWSSVIVRLMDRARRILVFVNNHYAGHGPATARRLKAMFEAQLARESG